MNKQNRMNPPSQEGFTRFLFSSALMPPLCKGRWLAARRDGGIVLFFYFTMLFFCNPSVSFADSSLYTREPRVLPR